MPAITLKDHFRETHMFNVRVVIVLVLSLLSFLAVVVRLVYLQIIENETYTTLSEDNRFFISAIPPTRGLIFDRNGTLLAENLPAYNLELIPERIKNIDATIASLGEIIEITDADIERFKEQLGPSNRFKPIPLKTGLSDEEVARIAVNRYRFPGVDIAARLIRHYPDTGLMSHAIGYVGRINEKEMKNIDKVSYEGSNFIGKTGIEHFYETMLHGHPGVQQIETNAQGRSLRAFEQVPQEPGINLHLTIDAALQKAAQEALGEESGSVIAIDPNTGDVLAFVSTPVFNPNLFVTGIDHKTYAVLRDDKQKPLFNRALRGQYPPGSTIKPFVGLAGLETATIEADEQITCRGWYSLPGDKHRYRDWKKTGHGKMSLHFAIVQSCDVYFYDLAVSMGIDRMSNYLIPFGFNAPTNIDITGELGGIMPTSKWKKEARKAPWYTGETVIAGIGQGYVLTTPLQLATATATLSKKGKRMRPRVVSAMENANTREIQYLPPVEHAPVSVIDEAHWNQVINAMQDVAHHWRGTAYRVGKDAKYKIAGKTGTAQVFTLAQDAEYKENEIPKELRDHALFIAFAPVENPQIAVSVIVEHGGHGSSAAAPIAKKVMDHYLLPKLEKPAVKTEKAPS
ncbi:MAG TPA: penicillin-binding protein 2 [Gammaproteobacteria bacterium]